MIRKKFLIFIVIICLILIIYALTSIFSNMYGYHQSAKRYESLQKVYQDESRSEKLISINQDYVGWIKIDDTEINYPVVKTKDNRFYLNHNFYLKEDRAGAIFMDYQNSGNQLDKNIILYGHNMKDDSMFGSLKKYADSDYAQLHRFISFDYLGRTYEWEIFSVYSSTDTEWMKNQFHNNEDFQDYVTEIEDKSEFSRKIEVTSDDSILTLSTCTNVEEDGRYIVHAKLMTKGE